MHDRITLQGVDVWVHTISLSPSLFVEVPVTSYECEQSCICMPRDIDIVDIALLRRFFDSILEKLLQYGICVIPIFTDN